VRRSRRRGCWRRARCACAAAAATTHGCGSCGVADGGEPFTVRTARRRRRAIDAGGLLARPCISRARPAENFRRSVRPSARSNSLTHITSCFLRHV
jgi:hypothetical protein